MNAIKISIIMPTYNDEDSIEESLSSIVGQSYKNYELIIANDGSTDGTEDLVKKYIDSHHLEGKFKYFYKKNADQLNAIKDALGYVTGDYIYLLHSDDIFANENVLSKMADECKKYPEIEAFIPKFLPIIDKDSNQKYVRKVRKFKEKKNYIKELVLCGGENLFLDMALFRKDVFLSEVYYNYLTWNRPYWALIEKNTTLKVKTLDFEFFNYRVFDENYTNSEIGLINVYNGVLRTFVDATEQYTLPMFSFQRIIYKIFLRMKCPDLYPILAFKKPLANKYKYIEKILPKEILKYPFYKSIIEFYKNKNSSREIEITDIPDIVYKGCDMRIFNKQMLNNNLPEFYTKFLSEIEKGFGAIKTNKKNVDKINDLLHFFCLKNVYVYYKEQ